LKRAYRNKISAYIIYP